MRTKQTISLLILLLAFAANVGAETYRSGGLTWSSTINGRGLYGRMNKLSRHTIALRISPNFYSGDVELPGNIFTGHNDPNMDYVPVGDNSFLSQVGFGVALQYTYRQNTFLAYRVQVIGGTMRGKSQFTRHRINSAGQESDPLFDRQFSSVFTEYSVGIEFYPIPSAGFFLYVGAGGTTSFITRNFNKYIESDWGLKDDKVVCTVPTIPVGLGYKIDMGSFQLGFEVMWHPAVVDVKNMNLDGWESGYRSSDGIIRYPTLSSTNRFTDSFAEIGISFGYRLPIL